ncbi:MAG: 3-keto-5-aminohexanoate cleavage protein [Actinomycetota bacterium]|nr:3-keto-5-aminohexanoate cleavage protein [Actinomycetota bacterium]
MYEDLKERFAEIPPTITFPFGEKVVDARVQPPWEIPGKVMIKAAITGALFDREQNPHQPYTPDEIVREAIECVEAGACSIHIHVRDENGFPSGSREMTLEVVSALRERFGNGVHIDGECLLGASFNEILQPAYEDYYEAAAVNTTATFMGDTLFCIPKPTVIATAEVLKKTGHKPQIAVYNQGDVDNAKRWLIDSGIVEPPLEWAIIPGVPGCAPMWEPLSMCETLVTFVRRIMEADPSGNPFIWVASGGRASIYLTALSILLGLHVRVGKEDTIWRYPHRNEKIEKNADVVRDAVALAGLLGREPMTASEYRKEVGLEERLT